MVIVLFLAVFIKNLVLFVCLSVCLVICLYVCACVCVFVNVYSFCICVCVFASICFCVNASKYVSAVSVSWYITNYLKSVLSFFNIMLTLFSSFLYFSSRFLFFFFSSLLPFLPLPLHPPRRSLPTPPHTAQQDHHAVHLLSLLRRAMRHHQPLYHYTIYSADAQITTCICRPLHELPSLSFSLPRLVY